MTGGVEELYDYHALRSLEEATMFVGHLDEPILVLGSSQSPQVLDEARVSSLNLRRRRGGGGLVWLRPGDVWIDWWIPAHDVRWSRDVRVSAARAGGWWREALGACVTRPVEVYDGPLVGEAHHRVVCFAGSGPGEVFVDGRKAVGLAQWRVHEGCLLTSVLPASRSEGVVDLLAIEPEGLRAALAHQTTSSLGIEDSGALVEDLRRLSGPWSSGPILLRS